MMACAAASVRMLARGIARGTSIEFIADALVDPIICLSGCSPLLHEQAKAGAVRGKLVCARAENNSNWLCFS